MILIIYVYRYGARLAEPTGYVIQDEIMRQVAIRLPNADSIWAGNKLITPFTTSSSFICYSSVYFQSLFFYLYSISSTIYIIYKQFDLDIIHAYEPIFHQLINMRGY